MKKKLTILILSLVVVGSLAIGRYVWLATGNLIVVANQSGEILKNVSIQVPGRDPQVIQSLAVGGRYRFRFQAPLKNGQVEVSLKAGSHVLRKDVAECLDGMVGQRFVLIIQQKHLDSRLDGLTALSLNNR